ncbi:MAG TPA: HAMP domain-containing sensor histidine kinase [Plantibacter sp.]|uniref:sensor histidine kinase n=1 Tax=unclassified Plantibacter TaxID=2624265 RepID=UPI002C0EE7C2|nr:HAMP domain-containing sensor histidine kinase [Plantibacter sp.]
MSGVVPAGLRTPRITARVKLTATYAAFTVGTGLIALVVINVIVWRFPAYPLTAPDDRPVGYAVSRGEIRDSLINYSVLALLAMAALGIIGGWFVAGRVLRPLQALNEAMRAASTGALEHRIGMTGTRDEFRDLADLFDQMLERLEQSFLTQKRFASNASHELRTPLATTKMLIEVAQADPGGRDIDRTLARLHETNERGIAIVEALLQLNRLERDALVTETVDVADVATAVERFSASAAEEARITLSLETNPVHVRGNRILLQQLLTNLVANGLRYNSGPGGRVEVRVGHAVRAEQGEPTPGQLALVVSNSGEQLTGVDVARFLEPFDRQDARLARAAGRERGNGLGLTLCARIVALHGGTITLTPRPEGGLTVTVLLPAAHV